MGRHDRPGGETGQIRDEVAQRRTEMGETVDAIEQQLSPEHLKERAKETARDTFEQAQGAVREAMAGRAEQGAHSAGQTAREAHSCLVETIKQNPVPAALAGLGLGWLVLNARSSDGGAAGRRREQVRRSCSTHDPSRAATVGRCGAID